MSTQIPAISRTAYAETIAVRTTPLLIGALQRIDWSDAYAVPCPPGTPPDPQAWADAVFRDPPRWVDALLPAREGAMTMRTIRRTDDEVLLGLDQRHLTFRISVRCEPDRIVLTTLVQVHNRRGRAYSDTVRRVHPIVVRSMLRRAAAQLAES